MMYTRETVMGVLNHGKIVYFGPTHSAFSNIPAFYESYTDAPGERSVVEDLIENLPGRTRL